ncbi:MAG: type II toxin-antitoxin system YoeB family toxin [Tannerella sp.]|nr:type II toxin-antitoxin system YoeB family toxin [Tannerella sp.]
MDDNDFPDCLVRRITSKHRLIYTIKDDQLLVFGLNVEGHYKDK